MALTRSPNNFSRVSDVSAYIVDFELGLSTGTSIIEIGGPKSLKCPLVAYKCDLVFSVPSPIYCFWELSIYSLYFSRVGGSCSRSVGEQYQRSP